MDQNPYDTLQRESDQRYPRFRFNIERDVGDVELEDWKKMHAITTHTAEYMSIYESERRKIMCAKCLIDPSLFIVSTYCIKFNRVSRNTVIFHWFEAFLGFLRKE
jgi:hypothetical protein